MESAKAWIECEALSMEGDEAGDAEARRMRDNLRLFAQYMPEYWAGAGVEPADLMVEYARLENMEAVRGGFLETVDEAHCLAMEWLSVRGTWWSPM